MSRSIESRPSLPAPPEIDEVALQKIYAAEGAFESEIASFHSFEEKVKKYIEVASFIVNIEKNWKNFAVHCTYKFVDLKQEAALVKQQFNAKEFRGARKRMKQSESFFGDDDLQEGFVQLQRIREEYINRVDELMQSLTAAFESLNQLKESSGKQSS